MLNAKNNKFLHLCWNNFQLPEETLTERGMTRSTHEIIIQEIYNNEANVQHNINIPRNKKRFIVFVPQQLEPCFSKPKAEPVLSFSSVRLLKNT